MALISGGELVVRTLRRAGVDAIFGLHGAHIDTIFQACVDAALPIIDTRNEMAAGHAAEGYARVGRRLGVALVTAGGGLTNIVTPMANAFLDRTPLLVLAGSGQLRDDETNTLQAGIDQVAIATPITKWAHRVLSTDHIPRLVAQAIRIAMTAPRGPVMLDLPWDILTGQIEEEDVPIPEINLPEHGAVPHPDDIATTLALLCEAKRPVIVVGSEASRVDSSATLAALAAASGIPIFSDYEALNLLGDIPESHHGGLVQGLYGWGKDGSAPDAVLMLGTRFGLNTVHGSGLLIPRDARIAQIDPDSRELGRLQTISIGIVADVAAAIEALAIAATGLEWPDFSLWRQEIRRRVDGRYDAIAAAVAEGSPVHPFTASQAVARHAGSDVILVADGALTYLWLSEVVSKARPGGFLCHGYLGSMGVGFGVALGAQAGAAGKRVILVTGDGAVGYSIAEFDTLVRQRLPLIVVVMNNQSWGATLHFQQLAVGANRVTNTRLENGAYHEVAAAFGADAYFATTLAELDEALALALSRDRPACINVMVRLDPIPPEEMILIGMDPFAGEDA